MKTLSMSNPASELQYGPTGISDGVHGELQAAPAYGDLAHGPHGTFIKMPAGYASQNGKFDYHE
jgi:beta-alanine degradation protein BauB